MNPRDGNKPPNECSELLQKLHAGTLTKTDFGKLAGRLAEDEDLRWQFIHDVHLQVGLRNWAKSHGVASEQSLRDLLGAAKLCPPETVILETGDQNAADWSVTNLMGRVPPLLLLALLAVPLGWYGYLAITGQPGSSDPSQISQAGERPRAGHDESALSDSRTVVARVVWADEQTRWSPDNQPSDFLMRLRPGDVIGIESGLVKIQFSDGALVLMHPSSLLQVTSATSARLMRGQATGRASNGNFTLSTPSATVVDIGTEFGVRVDKSGTGVTVFEGEVHVHGVLGSETAGSMQRLTRGMSLTIDSDGTAEQPTIATASSPDYRRELFRVPSYQNPDSVSLLDLICGQSGPQSFVAGSIDPATGYWGRPPWADPSPSKERRGDTQFTPTNWNAMVDGVFIPRSNAREMQIDSDGHMVYLPPNSGATWGPVWARRRSELDGSHDFIANRNDDWGNGKLEHVLQRLSETQAGILGLHANVGITFDLDAVRSATGESIANLKAGIANLGGQADENTTAPHVDLRIFVDGKMRYSRIAFGPQDGEEPMDVSIDNDDRFVTIVATDAGKDSSTDHVVLIDPVFRSQPE